MNMAQTHIPAPSLQQRFPERLVQLADGAQLAIRECGQGPVVVLLHGIGSGSASWLHCAQRLAAGNRVIAWDAPGYGLSTPLPPARPRPATTPRAWSCCWMRWAWRAACWWATPSAR